MNNKREIIVPSKTELFTKEQPNINLREIIPDGYDITGIHIDFPDNLDNIKIVFGDVVNPIIFDKSMIEYIKKFPIYLTLCKYIDVIIYFTYNKNWIYSNVEYVMEDEYKEEDILGEEDVTIWDGYDYFTGKLVFGKRKVPTGKQVCLITKGVEVTIPEITFTIEKINHNSTFFSHIIRQKIDTTNMRNDYKDILLKHFNLTTIDNINSYVDNKMYYTSGLASLMYSHT